MTKSYNLSKHNVVLFFGNYFEKPACLQTSAAKKMNVVKAIAMLFFICCATMGVQAQVTTNSGSGLNATYPDLVTAITALNGATLSSPVTITLTGNETAPAGGFAITATGTAANPISIKGITS